MSATVAVALQPAHPYFAQGGYHAPAGEPFTLKITNSMFTVKGNQPVQATVVISPSHDPAITPVPGRPGWFTGSTARAVFVAPPVTAPDTAVVTVPALAAGSYVMQLMKGSGWKGATLTVG